jgi:hypothetical protein
VTKRLNDKSTRETAAESTDLLSHDTIRRLWPELSGRPLRLVLAAAKYRDEIGRYPTWRPGPATVGSAPPVSHLWTG